MEAFTFYNPVMVVFGPGKRAEIGQHTLAHGKKALLVTYTQTEFLDELIANIESQMTAGGGETIVYRGIEANPTTVQCQGGIDLAKAEGCDVVIAVGGGSAMDAAKIIAGGVKYDGKPWDMIFARHDEVTARPPEDALPIITVPTLPATASEMNCGAVLTNAETHEKSYVFAGCFFPKVAVMDPELTLSLPDWQTACGCADAISHVMEIYMGAPDDTPLQDEMMDGVIRTLADCGLRLKEDRTDLSARTTIMWAAGVAWNGWLNAGCNCFGTMHQFAHPLSARFNTTHGATLSIVMPTYMRYCLAQGKRIERLVGFALDVWGVDPNGMTDEDIAAAGIDLFEAFLKELGCPTNLTDGKIPLDAIDDLVNDVKTISLTAEGKLIDRPYFTADDIKPIYEAMK